MRVVMLLSLVVGVPFIWGTAHTDSSNTVPEVLHIKNSAHSLTLDIHNDLEFYTDFKLDRKRIIAKELILRGKNNKWYLFKPLDHESLHSSMGYYSEVWSPSNTYLVLPLGRFEGFAL